MKKESFENIYAFAWASACLALGVHLAQLAGYLLRFVRHGAAERSLFLAVVGLVLGVLGFGLALTAYLAGVRGEREGERRRGLAVFSFACIPLVMGAAIFAATL